MQEEITNWMSKIDASGVEDTPYMLTDIATIRRKCSLFKRLFPQVKLFYALKAFSDDQIVLALDDLVAGYDVASISEIRKLRKLGVSPERIAFSNPVKPEKAIKEAADSGVTQFAFQSASELEKIARVASSAEVYVRVKMEDSHSAVPLSSKYGCAPEETVPLLVLASRLGLRPIGITFHVGSQQTDPDIWRNAIKRSQDLLSEARSKGLEVSVINIGGGFPVQYMPDDPRIEHIAESAKSVLGNDSITYIAEPGRFIVADSSVIVSSVIAREERSGTEWLYLDVGVFQAFTGAIRFSTFPYPPYSFRHARKKSATKNKSFILAGPSCDSQDTIARDVFLPVDIAVGDKLVFPKTGAYTVVYGANFNGFEVPPRHFLGTSEVKSSGKYEYEKLYTIT